jgi:hypothetical protein
MISNALASLSIPSCSSHHQPLASASLSIPSSPQATASGVARISPPSSSAWAVRSPSLRPWSAARPAATCAQPWLGDCAIGKCPDKPMTRHVVNMNQLDYLLYIYIYDYIYMIIYINIWLYIYKIIYIYMCVCCSLVCGWFLCIYMYLPSVAGFILGYLPLNGSMFLWNCGMIPVLTI